MIADISDLLLITISITPRQIEQLLDALARLPWPINPELIYEEWMTHVRFPAYRAWVPGLNEMLAQKGFDSAGMTCTPALEAGTPANRVSVQPSGRSSLRAARNSGTH